MHRTFSQDASDVARLAKLCIGNPERQAAREKYRSLIAAGMWAHKSGNPEEIAKAQAELDAYKPEYRRITGSAQ